MFRPLVLSLILLTVPCLAQEPDLDDLVAADTAFACDLYQALRKSESGNVFYSPLSISSALTMTWAGARGRTADEMARTLRFEPLRDSVHAKRGGLDRELARRQRPGRRDADGDPFRLRLSNDLWGQVGQEFRPEFLELVAEHYGAGLKSLDFRGDPDGSRRAINAAIEDRTEKRIRDLLQPGDVHSETRLVLTNAIWFKASWAEAFVEGATRNDRFHRPEGDPVEVPFMRRTDSFLYLEEDGLQAIDIPYVGDEVAMTILLPAEGRLSALEDALTGERLVAILSSLRPRQVELRLPRFGARSRFKLREVLAPMGMPTAFSDDADFSGMTGARDLEIDEVIHQSFVQVDEKGTEAAAATAVTMRPTSAASDPVPMKVDRPFVFLVRDRKTGAILFLGRIVDPGKSD